MAKKFGTNLKKEEARSKKESEKMAKRVKEANKKEDAKWTDDDGAGMLKAH